MKFIILESALFEDLESVKQYYPNIDDDAFITLIELDPTHKKGSDKLGNYGKWILNLYKQGKLKEEDFYKVTDYLKEFDNKKKNFKNKDIGQFKSLSDLAKALDNTEDVEKSDRQIRRDKTKSKEYDIVFKDDKWTIYVPKSYGANRMLGDGTQWCTASSDDRYFDQYSKQGTLYILISNSDQTEKYQFHFESNQFMDKWDDDILDDVKELINDDKVFDFFRKTVKNVPMEFINFDKLSKEEYDSLVGNDDCVVRTAVAEQGIALDRLINDEEPCVRIAVAKQGYGLNKLINDENNEVRLAVAEQGYGLDKLINDEDTWVRMVVAQQGYGLDKLINDEDHGVRQAVAEQGYGLDKLVIDEDWRVRAEVARQGYGLDKLINDTNPRVRQEVAKQNYGLEKLVNDEDSMVRLVATWQLA